MKTQVALILSLFIIFTSCSKDKRIERRLLKKEGVWNITSLSQRTDYHEADSVEASSFSNAGTITFKDDLFSWNILAGDLASEAGGNWINTSEKLIFLIGEYSYTFEIEKEEKKKMVIAHKRPSNFASYVMRMTLERD